jgi:hypothetical protein
MDLLRFSLAPSLATQEAVATCASAAEPQVPETRQAGEYTVTAPAAQAGQWRLIRSGKGEAASRLCTAAASMCGTAACCAMSLSRRQGSGS